MITPITHFNLRVDVHGLMDYGRPISGIYIPTSLGIYSLKISIVQNILDQKQTNNLVIKSVHFMKTKLF